MRKIIFAIIIIITLPNYLIAQNKIKYNDLKYRDNDIETGYYNGKPFDGIVVGNLAIGSLMETNYVNGKPDGLRRDFYSNGNIMLEEYIKSTVGWWNRGGPKYPEFNIGMKKEYSINGELILLEEYFPDGKLKNSTKYIYSDSFVDFTTGKRTPLPISKTTYISNGIYEIKVRHESNGNFKEIYKINTSVKNNYGGSSKFGIYKTFFDNGKIQQEGNITLNYTKSIYNNDLLIGVWKFYYKNGHLESTGLYSINKWTNTSHKDKEWKYFYENGVLKEKGNYKAEEIDNDFKVGKWQEFYENGKLKNSSNYINNKLEGYYIKYKEDGSVLSKEKYWNGELIEKIQ